MRNTDVYKNNSIGLLEDNDLLEAPIDVNQLALNLNIDVVYCDLNGLSGKIDFNPNSNKATISINNTENDLRQRFSLAHEISHYIYDIDFTKEIEIADKQTHFRGKTVNPIERRADKFAEKLLMPSALFKEQVFLVKDELFPDLNNTLGVARIYQIVESLTTIFNVSRPAIIFRLASVNIVQEDMKWALYDYYKAQFDSY